MQAQVATQVLYKSFCIFVAIKFFQADHLSLPISSGIQTRALSVSSLVLQLLNYHRCQILLMMTKDKGTEKKFLAKEIID